MAAITRAELDQAVISSLEEALNVDVEDIKPMADIYGDLGAESIDILDIEFRIEREVRARIGGAFSTDKRRIEGFYGSLGDGNNMAQQDELAQLDEPERTDKKNQILKEAKERWSGSEPYSVHRLQELSWHYLQERLNEGTKK